MDNVWSSPVLVAAASGVSLVLKAAIDKGRTYYRKSQNGDRRKVGASNGHDDNHADLRELIRTEAGLTRQMLTQHADEDTRRFNEVITRFESDSKLMHDRYHEDTQRTTKLMTEVALLMQGKVKHT